MKAKMIGLLERRRQRWNEALNGVEKADELPNIACIARMHDKYLCLEVRSGH